MFVSLKANTNFLFCHCVTSLVYFKNKTCSVKITATPCGKAAGCVATFHINALLIHHRGEGSMPPRFYTVHDYDT
ncbi:hypothetical protein GBP13_06715 [Pediococcus acidilactici]|nr:hypothetical protein GBO50_06710 [Pediococcus acidilactici]KAF0366693.1 hypothetical protein GBO55_07410 [Pediococcus acidilactici]KAF0418836.1 hypothetical protein GBO80_04290 [Pediococcus acidilactici]KAF0421540.1 hypothetical protein GBO82_04290 [Pediococcus acidilactici]KAF0473353.1 hypothetical protein GBP08_06715 [Pediococcus acidilactici]